MRVAHLVESLEAIGGVATYLGGLLPGLQARGYENVLLTADGVTSDFAGVRRVHVPAVGSEASTLSPAERRRLLGVFEAEAVDVAYVHVTRNPAVLDAVATIAPVVFYAHDYYAVCPGSMRYLERSGRFCHEGAGARCFWRAYTERTTSRRPDRLVRSYGRVRAWRSTWSRLARVLVASQFVADVLAADGVPRPALRVVPYFVDAVPGVEAGKRDVDVLFLGRLVAAKGVEVLVRALAELDGVRAVVAGDGPDRRRLETLVRELGMTSRVTFRGWVNAGERRDLLATSRVLAVPSMWDEPFGIVGLEALAAGVPVVATAVGGIPSWLDDEVSGLLVPRGDASQLAVALARILCDQTLWERFAAAGPVAARRFTLERHLELLMPELEAATGIAAEL